ncbi:MAG: indolepyruvate ferredoxin oxidoreductase subunit alpha, partial [Lentisphaeria bacterium]
IMSAKVNPKTCIGCTDCISSCPTEAISMVDDKAKVDTNLCVVCGACVDECPVDAISLLQKY